MKNQFVKIEPKNIGDSNLTMFTLCCTPEQFLEKLEQK